MVMLSSTITMPVSSLCSSFTFFVFDFAAFTFGVVTLAFDFAVFAFDFAAFTFGVVTLAFDTIFFTTFFSVINVEKQEVTLFLNIMQNNSFKKVESKTHVLTHTC